MKPTECEEFLCFNEDADYAYIKLLSAVYDRAENTLTANYIYAEEINSKVANLKPKLEQLFIESTGLPLTYKFTYTRAYIDAAMLKLKIYEFLKTAFAAMSVTVKDDDIQVTKNHGSFIINLFLERQFADFLQNSKNYAAFIKKLTDENFYEYEFHINLLPAAENPEDIDPAPDSDGCNNAYNSDVSSQQGISRPNKAYNITDKEYLLGVPIKERPIKLEFIKVTANEQIVAGEISQLKRREYTRPSGEKREYFTFTLSSDDRNINAVFFPNKKNINLFAKLKDGDFVVVIGIYGEKNGRRSINISGISYCQPAPN